MTTGKSIFLRDRILNFIFAGGAAFVPPASVWLRLYITTITSAGVGTQMSAASYAPKEIPLGATHFPVTTTGEIANAEQIPFGTANEDWGLFSAWGLWTAQTGGNLLWWGNLDEPVEILEGTVLVLPIGMLIIGEDNE